MESDREKVIAFQIEMRERCSQCGVNPNHWLDDPTGLVAEAYVCPHCEALEWEAASMHESGSTTKGVHYRLVPKEKKARPKILKNIDDD